MRELLRQAVRERDEARAEIRRLHALMARGQCPCCIDPREVSWTTKPKQS